MFENFGNLLPLLTSAIGQSKQKNDESQAAVLEPPVQSYLAVENDDDADLLARHDRLMSLLKQKNKR